jgi:hypothetical protein
MTEYHHTQKAPLCLLVYGTSVALFVGCWAARDEMPIAIILGITGVLTLFLGMAFHHLTVADQGDQLDIRFGPLPLFRRTVQYADIEKAEVGRTLILDGWGIHYSIRGGWVWNLWGRDCVVFHLNNGGFLRIGTDDAENLAGFLEDKVQNARQTE